MIYLLHFDRPISDSHTTQHYLGYSEEWENRVNQHRDGDGSRLCQVARNRGINFTVARLWIGDRDLERQLKKRKNSKRLCPICTGGK